MGVVPIIPLIAMRKVGTQETQVRVPCFLNHCEQQIQLATGNVFMAVGNARWLAVQGSLAHMDRPWRAGGEMLWPCRGHAAASRHRDRASPSCPPNICFLFGFMEVGSKHTVGVSLLDNARRGRSGASIVSHLPLPWKLVLLPQPSQHPRR